MKTFTLKHAMMALCITLAVPSLKAQDQAGNVLRAGLHDGNAIIRAYLTPTLYNFAQGVNDGWVNTAKPLGMWGLDLRLNLGVGILAVRDQSFNINEIGLNAPGTASTYVRVPEGRDPNFPTLYGAKEVDPPKIEIRGNAGGVDTTIAMFTMLNGIGSTYSPTLPILQLGVGIWKNTEVVLRYFPKVQFPTDYESGLFGICLKHDLVQWIPKYADLDVNGKRPFDLAIFSGFTNYSALYKKTILAVDPFMYNPDPSISYNNQRLVVDGSSWTIGLIVSKEFNPFRPSIHVEPYAGINYAYSYTRVKYQGDFPMPVPNDEMSAAHPQTAKIQRVTDPIDFELHLYNVRANVGARVKFQAVAFSAEYSVGRINTVTLTAALNFQSLKPFKI